MASYNKVVLVGNVTRDPELRYTPSSMAVIDIGLAVNDRRKGPNGDWIDETTFVDITLWGRTAEIAGEYLKKGTNTLIEGRLKLDSWQDKDGQKRSKLKVVGEKLVLLGGRPEGGGGGGGGGRGASRGGGAPQYDESEYNPANDFDAPQASRSGGAQGGGGSAGGDDDIPF